MYKNGVSDTSAPHLRSIYTLFGVSVLVNVLFPLAVLWALWQRSHATHWAESHYRYLLVSSAWAAGLMLASAFLIVMKVTLGSWFVIPVKLWFAYRLFQGIRAFLRKQPI